MLDVRKNLLLSYRRFTANSLGDCIDIVNRIKEAYDFNHTLVKDVVMWFRGQSCLDYQLTPSLYRETCMPCGSIFAYECEGCNGINDSYSVIHSEEEIRYQYYRAKNIGLNSRDGEYSRIEWLEHMQHYGMKTRLLDWTESLLHAILFAMEPLLNGDPELETDNFSPHIWVLFPQMLNATLLNMLHGDSASENKYAELWMDKFGSNLSDADRDIIRVNIYDSLEKYSCAYGFDKKVTEDFTNLLFNLDVISKEVKDLEYSGRIVDAMKKGANINPLFPLINDIYLDGRFCDDVPQLPPVAYIQSRRSKRIASQHGVFTLFPFYSFNGLCPILPTMENMEKCRGLLFRIELYNAGKIVDQLLEIGVTRDWLYPEDPIISQGMES